MPTTYFRVHPSINFARVGVSDEYYIAPETAAGKVIDKQKGIFGGLPIKTGTENTPVEASDLRDAKQNPRRQAARFQIFAYDRLQPDYLLQDAGREVAIGDVIGGKIVRDIIWQVRLANKKVNNYNTISANSQEEGIAAYENNKLLPVRNPQICGTPSNPDRISKLVIDAGPRAISSSSNGFEDDVLPIFHGALL